MQVRTQSGTLPIGSYESFSHRNNLNAATKTLGTRTEIAVVIIGKLVDSTGRLSTSI
ncbi:MAG: hypothetical protein QOF94_2476 [Acidobacteriaceae bacterium]